jgi:hypothetical protein
MLYGKQGWMVDNAGGAELAPAADPLVSPTPSSESLDRSLFSDLGDLVQLPLYGNSEGRQIALHDLPHPLEIDVLIAICAAMFRKRYTLRQGMSAWRAFRVSESLCAASPRVSRRLRTASCAMLSWRNASLPPRVYCSIRMRLRQM